MAVLDIPPVSDRVRRLHIDMSFVVRTPAESTAKPWLDGRKRWSRRIDSSNPGEPGGLARAWARTLASPCAYAR